ncbi:MAG TPA: hypothetical protein VKA46_41835 [Gemmataceae bacterium]|nr:hypothetical protein [Gemmataceae bacterium]
MIVGQNVSRRVEVTLNGGTKVLCASRQDAELVLDADRRRYEGNTGRKLPRQTLDALRRAGHHEANSDLYRVTLNHMEADDP